MAFIMSHIQDASYMCSFEFDCKRRIEFSIADTDHWRALKVTCCLFVEYINLLIVP